YSYLFGQSLLDAKIVPVAARDRAIRALIAPTSRSLCVRFLHVDLDLEQLPLAFRNDESEIVIQARRGRVEISLNREGPVIDLRLLGAARFLGGEQVEVDALVPEFLEGGGEFLGRQLIAERFGELGMKDGVVPGHICVVEAQQRRFD